MESLQKLKLENHRLQARVELLEKEVAVLQKELHHELDLHEKDLQHFDSWQQKYNHLEKRYQSLSRSMLGGVTLKYWKLKKKLSGQAKQKKGGAKS